MPESPEPPETTEEQPVKDGNQPQGRAASTIREAFDGLRSVARWGPLQAVIVAFIVLLAVLIALLGWKTWADEQSRKAEREQAVAAQAQILRYAASESELQRQFTSAELEKMRTFHTGESEKVRAQETGRREDAAKHMREAFDTLRTVSTAVDKLTLAVEKLKLKTGPDSP